MRRIIRPLEVMAGSVLTLALVLSPVSPFLDRWDFGPKTKFLLTRSSVISPDKHQHPEVTATSAPPPSQSQTEDMSQEATQLEISTKDAYLGETLSTTPSFNDSTTDAPATSGSTAREEASSSTSTRDPGNNSSGGDEADTPTEVTTEVIKTGEFSDSREYTANNSDSVVSEVKDQDEAGTPSVPEWSVKEENPTLIVKEELSDTLLPAEFRENIELRSKISNKYKDLQTQNSKTDVEQEKSDSIEFNSVELGTFGKVTTTTVDPIAELLSNVKILDVKSYIPLGYKFVLDDSEEREDEASSSQGNINDLLLDDELRRKKLKRKSKQLSELELNDNRGVSTKPGKLNGRLLAKISQDMKVKSSKAEEDLYFETFGGSKKKYGWKELDESQGEELKVKETPLEYDPSSLFESLLGNDGPRDQSIKPKLSKPLTSPPRSTTPSPTTSSYRTSTLGVCGQFCGLTGALRILSGLDWREELLHDFTEEFRENKRNLERLMTEKFSQVYFGNALEFCSVDAFSRLGDTVVAEFYLQFSGIVFNVTSADVNSSWVDLLDVEDGQVKLGKFVIDVNNSHFQVVDTEILNEADNLVFAKYGVELPDWAWLVVMAGIVSTFIVALLGVVFGVQKYRMGKKVKKRVLNAKTLEALRNNNSFDMIELDHSKAYEKDKRDLWTLQRAIQNESRMMKVPRANSQDSGHGSGSSYVGPFNGVFQRFPSLRGRHSNGVSVNDSQAGLLNSYDNTGYQEDCDLDTSYENNDSDSEQQEKGEISRQQLVEGLVEERERDAVRSSDSDDAVSDGPSERF